MKVSIIISSFNRPESLTRCIKSIEEQDCRDYEIILSQKEGALVEARDWGWRQAKGEILIWLDDDVVCQPHWLKNIVTIFNTREDIVGVTGPTCVPTENLKNRDVFRGGIIGWLYDKVFLEGKKLIPGQITKCGVNTHGANYPTLESAKTHLVDFLEPSQFAIRKEVVEKVNGFDLGFEGVGEWCDVDLCYRIRQYGKLIYHPEIKVFHYPTNDNTTKKRLETASRYRNYCRWSDRYIKKSFRHYIYRLFLLIYFKLKGMKII